MGRNEASWYLQAVLRTTTTVVKTGIITQVVKVDLTIRGVNDT